MLNHTGRVVVGSLTLATVLSACAAPFSEMQGARMAGVGRVEVTPTISQVQAGGSGEVENAQRNFGVQVAAGVRERVDIRLRYERIVLDDEAGDGAPSFNVLAAGPKFSLIPDRLALYLPVGFGFDNDFDVGESFQTHPTMLLSLPLGSRVNLDTSVKGLIPIGNEDADILVAANVGLGFAFADGAWVLRPEFGVLRKPNASGHFRHFTVGVTRGFSRR